MNLEELEESLNALDGVKAKVRATIFVQVKGKDIKLTLEDHIDIGKLLKVGLAERVIFVRAEHVEEFK